MDRIKKFKDEHRTLLTFAGYSAGCAVAGAVIYTNLCGRRGFSMVRPLEYNDEGVLRVVTPLGRILVANAINEPPVKQA